ncbi:hypothetical protein OEA41_001605 [Lepraria neglecta]|uniref:BTB domain-containing protein n=1 Tax=Lepraria neglecta TaxID=209136 RepID=A0AAE0DLN2_9LECA|nr:hypothetical protein OEA41_001605 [Lepraria neglecta]
MDRDSFDAIVIVKLGPSKTPFNMHKGLLCNAAPYFKAAFNGNFTEAKIAVLELPEEDVVMSLHLRQTSRYPSPPKRHDRPHSRQQATENIVPTTLLHRVYENLPDNSPLRKLLVDWSSSLGGLDMWFRTSATVDQCPKEFLIDLTVALYLYKKGTVGNLRLNRLEGIAIVQVKVGPQLIPFDLHQTLLCNAAGYFKTALQRNLLESKEQIIELSRDDPKAFTRFQLWLYTENLLEKEESRTAIPWKILIDIYVFSYIHGVPDLQNVVIDAFIDKHAASRTMPISTLSYLYDKTTKNSPLRRLVIDLTAYSADLDNTQ